MNQRRRIGVIFAVAGLLVTGFYALNLLSGGGWVALTDGSRVRLEQVTFGKAHQFTPPTPLYQRFEQILPAQWQKPRPFIGTATTQTDSEIMVGWVTQRDLLGKYVTPRWRHYKVLDDHGCVLMVKSRPMTNNGNPIVSPIELPNFPHRQAKFTVTLHDSEDQLLGKFTVRNSVSLFTGPAWTPEPVPTTKTNGGLAITLSRVDWETDRLMLSHWPTFEVSENGQSTRGWKWDNVLWQDVTGNRARSNEPLCTRESAWKLTASFYRLPGATFSSNEVWTVPNVPMMAAGSVTNLNLTNTIQGVTLELLAFAGAGITTIAPGVPITSKPISQASFKIALFSNPRKTGEVITQANVDTTHVALQMKGLADDQRLLVRAFDNQGRAYEGALFSAAQPINFFQLKLPADVTSLSLQFIVQKVREVEFFVKPPSSP